MQETPQEYIRRMLALLEGQAPLKIQAATPKKLGRLIGGARREAAQAARPGEMVRRGNPRASRGLRNCDGLADAANSGRSRDADSSI